MDVISSYNNKQISNNLIYILFIGLFLGRYTEMFSLIFVTLCVILYRRAFFSIYPKLLLFLSFLFFSSFFLIHIQGYDKSKFIQQFILISIFILLYYQLFSLWKGDLSRVFCCYTNLSYLIAILGLIQVVIWFFILVDIFPYSIDGGRYQHLPSGRFLKARSIIMEPGFLALILIPVIIYYFERKDKLGGKERKKFYIILLCYILTFSAAAYIVLFIYFIYRIYYKYNKQKYIILIAFIFLIPAVFGIMSSFVEGKEYSDKDAIGFAMRKIVETSVVFEADSPEFLEVLNPSSYATTTNLWVAMKAPSRAVGTGLGSHEFNYNNLYPPSNAPIWGLNSEDGYSLFIRLLSEFGIVGVFLYFLFLIKFYNKNNVLNVSSLFFILYSLLRGGNYLLYGVIFFHFLYIYTSKRYINVKVNNNN